MTFVLLISVVFISACASGKKILEGAGAGCKDALSNLPCPVGALPNCAASADELHSLKVVVNPSSVLACVQTLSRMEGNGIPFEYRSLASGQMKAWCEPDPNSKACRDDQKWCIDAKGILCVGKQESCPEPGCTKDTDCKGDRICVQGKCTADVKKGTDSASLDPNTKVFEPFKVIKGESGQAAAVIWASDGNLVALVTNNHRTSEGSHEFFGGQIRIFRVSDNIELGGVTEPSGRIEAPEFSPNGESFAYMLCFVDRDRCNIKFWQPTKMKAPVSLDTDKSADFTAFAFAPKSHLIALNVCIRDDENACIEGRLGVMNVRETSSHAALMYQGNSGYVFNLMFRKNGSLITGSFEGGTRTWSLATGKKIKSSFPFACRKGIAGRGIASCDLNERIGIQEWHSRDPSLNSAYFGKITVFDIEAEQQIQQLENHDVSHVVLSPDGSALAGLVVEELDTIPGVYVWRSKDAKWLGQMERIRIIDFIKSGWKISSLEAGLTSYETPFSISNRFVAAGVNDKKTDNQFVVVSRIDGDSSPQKLNVGSFSVIGLSPEGKILVTGDNGGVFKLWKLGELFDQHDSVVSKDEARAQTTEQHSVRASNAGSGKQFERIELSGVPERVYNVVDAWLSSDTGSLKGRRHKKALFPFWVGVPGGSYKSCLKDGIPDPKDQPQVQKISDFLLGAHETTQLEWKSMAGEKSDSWASCPDCPVDNVPHRCIKLRGARAN
jgi:WD40 repeat protein